MASKRYRGEGSEVDECDVCTWEAAFDIPMLDDVASDEIEIRAEPSDP